MCRANENPAAVYEEAVAAASAAIRQRFADGFREQPFNCGFAWVDVNPARGAFVNWCKSNDVGSKGYPKGWSFWSPGSWPSASEAGVPTIYSQDMDMKLAGARAFAAVLRENGVNAAVGSRLD